MTDIAKLREALERSVILLDATERFLSTNPVMEYMVHYDEADCDGHCLAEDCENAAMSARAALQGASK